MAGRAVPKFLFAFASCGFIVLPIIPLGIVNADDSVAISVNGLVVDPTGKPTEANVRFVSIFGDEVAAVKAGSDGKFRLEFNPEEVPTSFGADWTVSALVATAKGYAPAWIGAGELKANKSPTLKLVEDDITISAQVVNSEGHPVEGAEFFIAAFQEPRDGNLDGYLKAHRDSARSFYFAHQNMNYLAGSAVELTVLKGNLREPENPRTDVIRTDKDGRIEFRGIGSERKINLSLQHSSLVKTDITILSRKSIDAKWKRTGLSPNARSEKIVPLYSAKFTHVGEPCMSFSGVVRDMTTGEPLKGVSISARVLGQQGGGFARTDVQGRFSISGCPTKGRISISTRCPAGMPYLNAVKRHLSYSSSSPLGNTDFELARGTVVRGKLLDPDGKPVMGRVNYYALTENEVALNLPDRLGHSAFMTDAKTGEFEIVAAEGRGLLAANTYDKRFVPASSENLESVLGNGGYISTISMGIVRPAQYDSVKLITVEKGIEALHVDLKLSTGTSIGGKLTDVEGEPVHGVVARGVTPDYLRKRLDSNSFTIGALRPGEKRHVKLLHEERRLGAMIEVDEEGPKQITVTMRPCATLFGRIVDDRGRPVANRHFKLLFGSQAQAGPGGRAMLPPLATPIGFGEGDTDVDGRFRFSNIISGVKCHLRVETTEASSRGELPHILDVVTLRSGESRDLGDVVVGEKDAD